MKENNLDRRVQKTRKLLIDALIELIIKKGYDAVTIQDIIDKANVGRSTFYAHFENKEQLLFSSRGQGTFEKLLEKEGNSQKSPEGPDINFMSLFEHVAEQRLLAKAMIGKNSGALVTNHLADIMAFKITDYLKQETQTEHKMINLIAEAAAAALISLLINWVEDDMLIPADEIADFAQKLLLKILD